MANEVVIHVRIDDAAATAGARRIRSTIGNAFHDVETDADKAGKRIGSALGKSAGTIASTDMLGSLMGKLSTLQQFGVAAGAVMAPEIGGLLAAGVIGAAGGIGIIGGLMVAKNDPAVKAAGAGLARGIGEDLKGIAQPMVVASLQGIDKVRGAWKAVLPDMTRLFRDSAKLLDPLLDGALRGARNLIHGIADSAAAAKPVFVAFGGLADKVLTSVGHVFTQMAEDAPTAARAVDELGDSLSDLITVTGGVIHGLTEMKHAQDQITDGLDRIGQWIEDKSSILGGAFDGLTSSVMHALNPISGITDGLKWLGDQLGVTSDDTAKWVEGNKVAAAAADAATQAAQGQQDALDDLSNSLRAQTDPAFALLNAQEKLKKAQKDTAKATRDHGRESDEAKSALRRQAMAALDLEHKAGALGAQFNGHLTPAMKSTLRAAGFTEAQIRDLGRQMTEAKNKGNAFAKRYAASVAVRNLDATIRKLNIARQTLANIDGSVADVYIRGHATGIQNLGGHALNAHGGVIGGAASGKVAGSLTWVGEQGPELVNLPTGSTVKSSGDSMRMMRDGMRSAGQGGSGVLTARVERGMERTLMGVLLSALRLEVSAQGGNVQNVLGRSH